jgi:hypothetical protein
MVLEVVVLGFVVLIVAPILFVISTFSLFRSRYTDKTSTDLLEHLPDMHWSSPDAKSDRDQTRDRLIEVDCRQHSSGQLHSGTTFGRLRQRNAFGSSTLPAEAEETMDAIQADEFYFPHLEIVKWRNV